MAMHHHIPLPARNKLLLSFILSEAHVCALGAHAPLAWQGACYEGDAQCTYKSLELDSPQQFDCPCDSFAL